MGAHVCDQIDREGKENGERQKDENIDLHAHREMQNYEIEWNTVFQIN